MANFEIMSLSDALAQLGSVKTNTTRQIIESWYDSMFIGMLKPWRDDDEDLDDQDSIMKPVVLEGITLSHEQMGEIHSDSFNPFGKKRISPAGVALLIQLYELDLLATKRNAKKTVSEDLVSYAALGLTFNDIKAINDASSSEERRARREFIERDLSDIGEAEFTYALLNDVFWHHGKKGNAFLDIGGKKVTKSVSRNMSNSGKSQDWSVTFSWTDDQDVPQILSKEGIYANNRRNDEGRSWGLPE